MDRFRRRLRNIQRSGDWFGLFQGYLHGILKLLVNIQPFDKSIISFSSTHILDVFELRIAINNLILLVSALDQIKNISSEDSVELRIYDWVDILFKILLEDLWYKVNHSLEKILIFEDEFRFAIT